MHQLHSQPEHAVGIFPSEGRGGWGLPRGKPLVAASNHHLLGSVVYGLRDEWVIEPTSSHLVSLRKKTGLQLCDIIYTYHNMF